MWVWFTIVGVLSNWGYESENRIARQVFHDGPRMVRAFFFIALFLFPPVLLWLILDLLFELMIGSVPYSIEYAQEFIRALLIILLIVAASIVAVAIRSHKEKDKRSKAKHLRIKR